MDSDGRRSDSLEGTDGPVASVHEEVWTKQGTVLDGRFVVERKIGAGGMGYVVAARHLELGQPVAIKLVLPVRAMSEEARNRLTREARAAARIKSSHVVRIFDVVTRGPAAPYLVMEHLTGETLRQRLDRTGPLPIDRAADIVIQACEALAEAHRSGTIHRDLKPSNLFLTAIPGRPCFVKVLDFGIAKTNEADARALTQSQALLASPAYASPEQLRASKNVDDRSDIWSLGVILYESVTGRPPFGGRTLAQIASEILRDAPTPPSAYRSDLSLELERVIMRCLGKDPADRFESVDSLVLALEPYARDAAKECLAYVRDLRDAKQLDPAEPLIFGAPSLGSTLTHASVASATARGSSRWLYRLLLASATAVPVLTLIVSILGYGREPTNATRPAETGPNAATTAPPSRTVTLRQLHPTPQADSVAAGAATAEPPPVPSAAKAKSWLETARTPMPSVPPSASARSERAEPTALEALPLNELLDERK